MKGVKITANIILTIVVLGMAIYLYQIIQEPIIFEKQKKERYEKTIQRLKDLRQIELAYKDVKGKFANNFNDLINTVVQDSFPRIRAIGEAPDSLTEEEALKRGLIIRDTTLLPLAVHAFPPPDERLEKLVANKKELKNYTDSVNAYVKQLRYIPYSNKKEFSINAGEIEKNKVTIQVFEISAPEPVVLAGLNNKYIDDSYELRVGSMTEGTYTGNWE